MRKKKQQSGIAKALIIGSQCLAFAGMSGFVLLSMIALTPAGMA